jgi:hypothetical protein
MFSWPFNDAFYSDRSCIDRVFDKHAAHEATFQGAIEIRDVSLHHIGNGQSGERYEVQMSIHNTDANWSATEICVHVRFRDPAKKLVDAHQTACLQNLNPL